MSGGIHKDIDDYTLATAAQQLCKRFGCILCALQTNHSIQQVAAVLAVKGRIAVATYRTGLRIWTERRIFPTLLQWAKRSTGATTAENWEGTSRGVDADPIPALPRLPLLFHPLPILSPTLLSFCPFNQAYRRSGEHCKLPILPSKNASQLQKLVGT